jgi:CheY-like chemotaxis protein
MADVQDVPDNAAFLVGGGEMGDLVRAHEWSTSPLGYPASWPQSLRSVAELVLNSKFPMFVAWGPDLGFLYNDATPPFWAASTRKHWVSAFMLFGQRSGLIELGFEVTEAGSVEEALRLIKAGADPDLLVTDHLMPGMNGVELARAVRALRPTLPVLVVWGYAELEGIARELPRLSKPFRRAELAAKSRILGSCGVCGSNSAQRAIGIAADRKGPDSPQMKPLP